MTLLLVGVLLVLAVSAGTDAIVRHQIPVAAGFWVVNPILYIRHGQNVDLPSAVQVPLGAASAASLFVLILFLRGRFARASPVLELAAALMIGGALANDAEILTIGSVTDFMGVRGSGIYSSGDVALDLGFALTPVAAFAVADSADHRRAAWIASGSGYAIVLVAALTDPRGLYVAILATVAVALGAFVVLVRAHKRPSLE